MRHIVFENVLSEERTPQERTVAFQTPIREVTPHPLFPRGTEKLSPYALQIIDAQQTHVLFFISEAALTKAEGQMLRRINTGTAAA